MKQKTIFEISDSASKQILISSESSSSKDWPLRIAVNVDSNGKFNTSTYKFTPGVAGFYFVSWHICFPVANGAYVVTRLMKNDTALINLLNIIPNPFCLPHSSNHNGILLLEI